MVNKCPNCEIRVKPAKDNPSLLVCGICGYEKVVATELLKVVRERDDLLKGDMQLLPYWDLPLPTWKKVFAFIGLPVEEEYYATSVFPMVSVFFVFAILAIQLLNLIPVEQLAFEPNSFWKHGGFSLFSYSLAHQNIYHLAGNLIFAWPFLDNVEEHLGHIKTFVLLVLSAVLSAIAHYAVSDIPLIGASGVFLAFASLYCLLYPKNRFLVAPPIGGLMMFRYRMRVRAKTLLIWYVGIDILFGLIDIFRPSSTSHAAHIGGAVAGYLFWLKYRTRGLKNLATPSAHL